MQQKLTTTLVATTLTAAMSLIPVANVAAGRDFGVYVEDQLSSQTNNLFGTGRSLEESAPPTTGPYRTTAQAAKDQLATAQGLKVTYLTRDAANNTDMLAFFPADNPTHLITCVEGGRGTTTTGKLNPSVQRINLNSGQVETILRGMDRCDPVRTTAWGTVIVAEETDDGGFYEILDPLNVTEQSIINRSTGAVTDPDHIAKRTALPVIAWEGIAMHSTGVVIGGDELRPGTDGPDTDGGAIFKFVPTRPHLVGTITDLADSPLASGNVYAMQVSCNSGNQQYGQGCEIGNAAWVSVKAATARADADANGATGYYRPEDMDVDPVYTGPGIRFCWTNTGSESAKNYAEVVCGVDSQPLVANANQRTVVVNRFVEGDEDFNSFDNVGFQPYTGNLYVVEDHDNGDIFACLPDGLDRDIKTDGCVKVFSVKDSSAEPTGFIFSADGKTAYVSIQHSNDANMPSVDGYPTDDVLKITGFKVKK